ncbi:hypothetical protein, partial [Aeromonas caviae]|uniref:hypothetical protein n=1 Tax=Aeromonas caviae TaxID=648 RepID=UPI001CC65585
LAATSLACVEEAHNQTGVFILATNDHSDTLTMAELLAYLFTRTGLTASVLPGWDNLSSRCTP